MSVILHVPEALINSAYIVGDDVTETLAWKSSEALQIAEIITSSNIAIDGIDIWALNEDGKIDFSYIFPSLWEQHKDESNEEYCKRSLLEACSLIKNTKFKLEAIPLFSFIPTINALGNVLVVNNDF